MPVSSMVFVSSSFTPKFGFLFECSFSLGLYHALSLSVLGGSLFRPLFAFLFVLVFLLLSFLSVSFSCPPCLLVLMS